MKIYTDYYVYCHKKSTDGSIFYIGKGRGIRAYKTYGRNIHWKRIVAKYGFYVEFIHQNLDENKALQLEIDEINKIGKCNLCNMTNGGDGASGYIHTKESKQKLSIAHMGRKKSIEAVNKMKETKRIRKIKMSEETRKKMSEARKGKKHTEESIQKMRDKANNRSAETIRKQVESNTGKKFSKERRENISKSLTGRTLSEEWRKKLRDAKPGIPVKCSNGMSFSKTCHAVEWLKSIGFLNPKSSSISNVCKKIKHTAYGFGWEYLTKE